MDEPRTDERRQRVLGVDVALELAEQRGTSSGGGGTYAASLGLVPPTQFGLQRVSQEDGLEPRS